MSMMAIMHHMFNACVPHGDHALHGIHALHACHAPTHYHMHDNTFIKRDSMKTINQSRESKKSNKSSIKKVNSIGKCFVSRT